MEQEVANDRGIHEDDRVLEREVHPVDIQIKRIYDPVDLSDGKRVLVDRLWPRGISKEAAKLDEWNREVAPSPDLRKWFCHKPELFAEFRERYVAELQNDPVHRQEMERLLQIAAEERLTLLYAAKDLDCNHAIVLQQALREVASRQ